MKTDNIAVAMHKPSFANSYHTMASETPGLPTERSEEQRGGSDEPSGLLSASWASRAVATRSVAALPELP